MDGGSACFPYYEVVGAKKVGNFFGPTFERYAMRVFLFDLVSFAIETADIVTQNDSDMGVMFENRPHYLTDMRRARGGEIENFEGRDVRIRGEFGEFTKAGAYGESGDGDSFWCDLLSN